MNLTKLPPGFAADQDDEKALAAPLKLEDKPVVQDVEHVSDHDYLNKSTDRKRGSMIDMPIIPEVGREKEKEPIEGER